MTATGQDLTGHQRLANAAAVTGQLARAEERAGAELVERGPRGARLTRVGAVLADQGRAIDAATRTADELLAHSKGELTHRLRIGAFSAAAVGLVPQALTALRHRHPDVRLEASDLISRDGVDLVGGGRIDVAVVSVFDEEPLLPAHLTIHHVMDDPLVLVLSDTHPVALRTRANSPVRLTTLRTSPWIAIQPGGDARAQFDRLAKTAGIEPDIRFETESYDVAQALVAAGMGAALVSRLALRHMPGAQVRRLAGPGEYRVVAAITRSDPRLSPLVPEFIDLLRRVASEVGA